MILHSALETITKGSPNITDLWIFIVCCVVVIIVVLFFLFYFNRVVARLITLIANQYLWRRYHAYIQLDSIRVTLLGARILFKNFRYHSTNCSFSVVKGHITVQYWLFNVQKPSSSTKGKSNDNTTGYGILIAISSFCLVNGIALVLSYFLQDEAKLPCRVVCSLEGLEGFIYNNIPVYERMKIILGLETAPEPTSRSDDTFTMNGTPGVLDPENQALSESSLLQRLVPIQIECTTGAVIIGNQQLQSYVVVKATQASGTYTTGQSRTPMDYYKATLDLILRKPQITLEKNEHYTKESQNMNSARHHKRTYGWWRCIWGLVKRILCIGPNDYTKTEKQEEHHHRYRATPAESHSRRLYQDEYAKIESLVECSQMALCYYADIPGPVPNTVSNGYSGVGLDIGNGGLPPEWGVRLSLWNAVFNYGPWADRQRSSIQDYFFPNARRTNKPTTPLLPGETRIPTSFDFMIDFMTDAKVRVPTKEASKDWKYTGDISDLDIDKDGYYTRPYGWLDIKFKEGSSLKTITPFVTNSEGCVPRVEVDFKGLDVTTSVNFVNLIHADGLKLHIDMPSPLVWNEHRTWLFDAKMKKPEIYLLRDHVYLIQDLIKDWTSGPPADLLYFVPITYDFQLDITQASIYLCVNEHNIINYPNSTDDNAYIILSLQKLRFTTSLPFITYQPEVFSIKYDAQFEHFRGVFSLQSSHTWSSFMSEDDSQLASCMALSLQGSYESYSTTDVLRHIESANLHLKFNNAVVKLFGTVIRYIMILRDNYVGSSLHFCTIDEYRQRRADPEAYLEMRKKESEAKPMSDPFELYLLVDIEDGALILPENLYECSHYSQLEFQDLQVELRNLDIYMDMYVTISPITWTRDSNPNTTTKRGNFRMKNARDPRNYLYIDETNIHAHRLFGPLPETATYLCHWEFDIGSVKGEIKPSFLMGTASYAQTFVYNLIDEDNAVSTDMAPVDYPDVTFLNARIREVDIYLTTQNSASLLQLQNGINVEFDNLTNEKYNQRVGIKLPVISFTCLANQDQSTQQQDNDYSWAEVARVELGLNVTIFRHTKEWQKFRTAQQNFIQAQDYLTGRCTSLYDNDASSRGTRSSSKTTHEHHVGVLYAPLFRSFPTHADSGTESEASSISTETPVMDAGRYSFSGDDRSMISFNDQWPLTADDIGSEDDSISLQEETTSMRSMVSNVDSFHTAVSEDRLFPVTSMSSNDVGTNYSRSFDEVSIDTTSEVESEDNYDYGDATAADNIDNLGYTITAIPPSIPYSGYLNRFAVKRATNQVGRGQTFFHPYVPPPKTTFIPLKTKVNKPDEAFDEHDDEFFAGQQDDMDASLPSDKGNKNDDDKRNDVVATTVLEATRPVKFLVTPILVKVVQEVTEIINKDDWDLETMLDSSQIEYVGQLTRYLTDKYICTRFAVWLPSTHLHFIQNVMIPADLPSYKHTQSHLQTAYDNEDEMLCAADIFLDDFQMIGGVTFQDYAFGQKQTSVAESKLVLEESRVHVNVGNMGCKVQYVSDSYENRRQVMFGIPASRQFVHGRDFYGNGTNHGNDGQHLDSDAGSEYSDSDHQSANELVVIDLEVNKFCCKWLGARKPNYLDFGINEFSTIIITESVEILIGAVYSWLVFVDDLQRILERFQDRRSQQNQVFIHELAKFSNDGTIVSSDPQFLTIPTSMGLRIGSKNFRNDVGWKLLARMRQCLRLMPLTMREKLQYRLTSGGAIEQVDSPLMYGQVIQAFSGWRSWEIDSRDIKSCRLFTKIFNQQRAAPPYTNLSNMANGSDNGSDKNVNLAPEMNDDANAGVPNSDAPGLQIVDDMVAFFMTSMNYAKFRINRFDFCIYEEEPDTYDNHIVIEPLEFAADTVYKTSVLGNAMTKDPPLSATTSAPGKGPMSSEGYLDAIVKLDIGLIEVSVNPTVLAFARHMLTVQWVFTNKLKSLSHATKSSSFFGRDKPTAYGPNYASSNGAQQSSTPQQKSLDVKLFLSRIDVVAHALVRIQHINLGAWAQKLTMKNNIHAIHGSVVFSNPRLSPVTMLQPSSERDSDTGSGKPSSNRTSRKQNPNSSRIIMNASGGIDSLDVGFYELLPRGSNWSANATNNGRFGSGSTRQPSKRIHTKLLAMTVYDAKLNANIAQPNKPNKKQRPTATEYKARKILKIFSSVGTFDVDAPQSLLRLYSFIEEWRSEQGKRYHFMFQNLLTEWEEQRRLTEQTTTANQLPGQHSSSSATASASSASASSGRWYDIKLQFLLVKFVAKADLLRSLSIKYSIDDLLVLVNETQQHKATEPVINYAFQLSKQVVELITHGGKEEDSSLLSQRQHTLSLLHLSNAGAFNLPGIRSSGTLMQVMDSSLGKTGFQLQSSISIDFIAMSLDVSMIDSILTAHNLLGNEVNELVEVFSYSKKDSNQAAASRKDTALVVSSAPFKYAVGISLDGLSIKAASPSATGLFESSVLEASVSNYSSTSSSQPLLWKVSGSNFSLSLDHGSIPLGDMQKVDGQDDTKRRNRLAYIVVDFGLQNQPATPATGDGSHESTSTSSTRRPSTATATRSAMDMDSNSGAKDITSYDIKITKVHTVMQPIALGKLAEMYIYYDSELKKKKEIKREEIEQLAANTKRIVESFQTDAALREQDIHSLWQGKHLSLVIENFGVAIPLSDMTEGVTSASSPIAPLDKASGQQHSRHHHQHAALLFALTSLRFTTKDIQTTTATIEDISLQFVKRFDQANEDHFLAATHPRMNQMRLPSFTCNVRSEFDKSPRKLAVQINAKVRGFEVDVDATIAEYVNRLGVIYVQSMDRVNAFSLETNGGDGGDLPVDHASSVKPASSSPSELVHLDVEGIFEYDTSIVRLYPKRQNGDSSRKRGKVTHRSTRGHGIGGGSVIHDGKEISESSNMATIKLPGLNAEFKYQTTLGASALLSESPRRFHMDLLIHESNNILHPSLVQFLHEVVAGLKLGLQLSSERKATRESATPALSSSPSSATPLTNTSNVNASVLLRLSKTKVDLTCQPASKVICSLGWSESEFILNSFADQSTRTMSCFGSLRSISAVVKHHFSPQSCLTSNIDRVLFNASLTSRRNGDSAKDDISIIVNIPTVEGEINMRHLQDLLILNTCWFAQPISHSQRKQQSGEKQSNPVPFASYVTLKLDSMAFSVDMGQAIGKVKLVPRQFSVQTHMIPNRSHGISLSLDGVMVASEGRLTGEAEFHRCILEGFVDTQLQSRTLSAMAPSATAPSKAIPTCQLYLSMDGCRAKFTYEYQNILELVQEPIQLTATVNHEELGLGYHHQLKVAIQSGRLIASVSIKTVPVIVVMQQRFMELLEKKRSEAGAVSFPWNNSATNTTLAMEPSVHPDTANQPVDSTQQYQQQKQWPRSVVELCVDGIQVIVYPSQFQDGDNVEIQAMKVEGSLQQTPKTDDEGIHRHLHLSIDKASLLKTVVGQEMMEKRQQQLDDIIATKAKQFSGALGDDASSDSGRKSSDQGDVGDKTHTGDSHPIVINGAAKQQGVKSPPIKEKGTSIFALPLTKLNMDSTQLVRHVKHTFTVDFKDRVQVSLNIGQMKYLQELVSMFNDQMARAKKAANPTGGARARHAAAEEGDQPHQQGEGDDATSLDSGIGVGDTNGEQQQQQATKSIPTSDDMTSSATSDQTDKFIYITDSAVHFDPQLRQMGDATPSVEWLLGFNRERLPGLIHENITLHLDQVVHAIWDFYQAQAREN
ncbi:hypothetical protein [Absidia glauca]|uniref:Csf1 N-terminal domain-containing protein n=1 Tax=Absidia glauca TaxID=4829 RepID=A0A163M6K2_ABSGL|nr:hypothetical protein [Absidia glauca]